MNESKRMSKDERRRQLLETAFQIVKSEGTDALTLTRVAERAGVTKPIAYEHFGTRAGLLVAMYQDYDERQTNAMRAALQSEGGTLQDVALILSAAYVDCAVCAGPEYGAITAALSATEEMEKLLQSCRDSFAAECSKAFEPFVKLTLEKNHSVLIGILGAAESLSQAAALGRLSRDEAVSALSNVMTGALKQSEKNFNA
ncbi:MAG: TetR/AcrR family transcriptional regulator [Acidobacteriota bacterium]|nr:TetR/AcrR family transcriptional regulator [Acidobacteriota bacterium]